MTETAARGERTLYIVNPTAQGGTGSSRWRELEPQIPLVPASDQICFTRRAGEAEALAASAIGFRTIVAVGGDGTVSEVLSGIMQHPAPRPRLAVIPFGTGNDIARQAGVSSIGAALTMLQGGRGRRHDLLQIDHASPGGVRTRYAFLFGSAGFTANPMVKPWMKRWLPPVIAYYVGLLLAVLMFRPPSMVVSWGGEQHHGDTWIVVAANAERAGGGGMCIAPGAATDDGKIYVTIIPAQSKWRVCTKLLPKLGSGDHVREPGVIYFTAGELRIASDPPAAIEIDGEAVGTTPAAITLHRGAVEILAPALSGREA